MGEVGAEAAGAAAGAAGAAGAGVARVRAKWAAAGCKVGVAAPPGGHSAAA